MKKENKKGMMAVVALAVVLVTVAATYAFITFVIEGTKTNTITGGSLVVSLDESANGDGDVISISNAFPVSDAVGKQSTAYKFSLVNESAKDVNYTVSLVPQAVEAGFGTIPNTALKVYLTDGTDSEVLKDVTLISDLGNNTLATGVIPAKSGSENTKLDFNLRLWIADTATDQDVWTVTTNGDGTKTTTGKQYAAKINVEAVQVAEYAVSLVNNGGGHEALNKAVFYGGTAKFNVEPDGNFVPVVTCKTSSGSSVTSTFAAAEDGTLEVTVPNVTDHTTCSVTYTQ